METIESKIQSSQYASEEDFVRDFEILFQNARHFNEEGSEIYNDSVTLEKALKKKKRWLTHITGTYINVCCNYKNQQLRLD